MKFQFVWKLEMWKDFVSLHKKWRQFELWDYFLLEVGMLEVVSKVLMLWQIVWLICLLLENLLLEILLLEFGKLGIGWLEAVMWQIEWLEYG